WFSLLPSILDPPSSLTRNPMFKHTTTGDHLCSLFYRRFSTHHRHLPDPDPPELVDTICRLLVLRRFNAINTLSFNYSDQLLNQILTKLRLNPDASLHFFNLASTQNKFRPNIKSYCKLVHILSRARMFDETRDKLRVLVGFYEGDDRLGMWVWGELVRVYREFGFSPTVFDIVLKFYAENGLVNNALHVFDEMCRLGRVPSLQACNGLLSGLVRKGEFGSVFGVYEQMGKVGIVPDVCTVSIVVNAYCKDGRVGKGLEFLKEVEEEIGLEPNVVTYNSLINGYVGIGDMRRAKGVLELMKGRSVLANMVTYSLFVKGYCKQGKVDEAEKVVRDMRDESPSLVLDEKAYGVLIDGYCRIGKMDCAFRIQDEMLKAGLKMNVFICNSMINGYCKLGRVNEAARVVTSMSKWKLRPDVYSFNTLVDGYCKEGNISKAFELCEKMVRDGIDANIVTYNTLLKGFCLINDIDNALKLWHLMIKRGLMPNEVGYGILLDGFFKAGDFKRALMLWKQFLAKGFIKPVIGFNTMLNGLCKMGKMAEAEQVFNKMNDLGCPPDKITYNTLADGYSKAGNMKMALEIKDTMEKNAIPLSVEMYNSLITGYFRSKKLNKVAELLNEMQSRVITPNIVTYGALISGWCKEGMLDKAFTTYFEMKEKGLAPNVVICSTIVSALYRFDMNHDANMLLHKIMDFDLLPGDKSFEKFFEFDMGKTNVKIFSDIVDGVVESDRFPNNVVYNVAIAGLCKLGKIEDAKRFISLLLQKGFVPDVFTYCTLIHALSSAGEVDKAFKLRDEMLTKGLVPDITTYNALLNGLCKSGNLDRAVRLFHKLSSKGVSPNVITYNTLIDGFNKTGNTRKALELKEKMVQEGIIPSDATYSCLINRVHKNGEVSFTDNISSFKSAVHRMNELANIVDLSSGDKQGLIKISTEIALRSSHKQKLTTIENGCKINRDKLLGPLPLFSETSIPVDCGGVRGVIHGDCIITFLNVTHFSENGSVDELVPGSQGRVWTVDLRHHASVGLGDLHTRVMKQLLCNALHCEEHRPACKSKQNVYREHVGIRLKLIGRGARICVGSILGRG
ncbi:hypothetical protein M8C21_004897, partial [Ambrosia artemisiifolia]